MLKQKVRKSEHTHPNEYREMVLRRYLRKNTEEEVRIERARYHWSLIRKKLWFILFINRASDKGMI